MKIAIIGGGFAGIVCATQLEKLGILSDIFERNNDIAELNFHHIFHIVNYVISVKSPCFLS